MALHGKSIKKQKSFRNHLNKPSRKKRLERRENERKKIFDDAEFAKNHIQEAKEMKQALQKEWEAHPVGPQKDETKVKLDKYRDLIEKYKTDMIAGEKLQAKLDGYKTESNTDAIVS